MSAALGERVLETAAAAQTGLLIASAVFLLLAPVFLLLAAREVRDPRRLARRRRHVVDHPVETVVVRAFATVLALVFTVSLGALALGVHPIFGAMLVAVVSAYAAAVWVWMRTHRPPVSTG